MRTLAFDGRAGASGDMLLGALVAAGADPDVLASVEDGLGVTYDIGTATRCGIEATDVTVRLTGDRSPVETSEHDHHNHRHDQDHHDHHHDQDHHHDEDHHDQDHHHDEDHHDHHHDQDHHDRDHHNHRHDQDHHDHHHDQHHHDHRHEENDGRAHAEGSGPRRTYPEVVGVVESLDLPPGVERDALAIFELLGEAEAAVHGTDLAETHFHEVGADDAIADIVGVALLLADLDPDRVVTTPPAAGGGTVETGHGRYPVPTPAVVELAERADWPLQGGPVEAELLTPTGAAVLAHVATGVESLPTLRVETAGYGAGDRRFENHPNALRALVGAAAGDLERERVTVLETNLDDASPELLGGLQETLPEAGALDVTVLPTTMKKSRPGHLVKVVVAPEDARRVARRLAEETGTLGVRAGGGGHRFVADRETRTVTLEFDGEAFEVSVKLASIGGSVYDVSTEFDDALAVARATDLPVRAVLDRAERRVREKLDT